MSYTPMETHGAEGSGESDDQTSLILHKNKLGYLLPILKENNTDFDELIEFEDDELQMWLPEISDKFHNKLDKIRFLKAVKQYRKLKQSSSLSSLSPSSSQSQTATPIVIDTETGKSLDTLKDHVNKTQSGITNLEKLIDELSDSQQTKHKYIEQECNKMIKQINQLKDNILKKKIDKICLDKITILQKQMNSFKIYLKTLNNAQHKVDAALLDRSLNSEARKIKIITPVKNAVNDKISFCPNVSPFMDVKFNASQFTKDIQKYWDIFEHGKPYHEPIEWLQSCGSGSTDILLSWKIPNASKQILQSINGYCVYFRKMNDDEKYDDDEKDISKFVEQEIKDVTSPTSYSLTNLTEASSYRILICSYNKSGKSVLSSPLVMKTNDKLVMKARINQEELQANLSPIKKVTELFAKMKDSHNFSDKLYNIFIRVDRRLFVGETEREICCEKDAPLNIKYGVNLSAPHIHIYALKQFEYLLSSSYSDKGVKFLDVGAGTGYVASLMAVGLLLNMDINKNNLIFKSYGCIYHGELLQAARNICEIMGLKDILSFHQSDTNVNNIGLKEELYFDGIYCGASITKHDANLLRQQLTIGGQLMCVVEMGGKKNNQQMQLVKRISKTNFQETKLFDCRFRTLRGRFEFL